MRKNRIIKLILTWMLAAPSSFAAQSTGAKPLPPPPAGFKVIDGGPSVAAMRSRGIGDAVRAEKPNANWPNCIVDPKIQLNYSWTAMPGADKTVEIMAQQPQEPARETAGTRIEPAGKLRYKSGVLAWEKWVLPVVGTNCRKDQATTYHGTWTGYVSGKLVGVSVSHVYGSKDIGQAWIDEYIDKIIAAVNK